MKVSCFQFAPKHQCVDENLAFLESELSKYETDIMVLPELAFSGYTFASMEELHRCCDTSDGKISRFFRDLSRKTGTLYVYGFAEAFGNRVFNSSAAVNRDGLVHLYRKLHLFDREKQWFSPGNLNLQPFKFQDFLIGMLVCFDHFYPEAARTLALQGTQILCHPSNLVLPGTAQLTTRVRAIENRVFWILANRIGKEGSLTFTGKSQIVSTNGSILASAREDEVICISEEIDPKQAEDKHVSEVNDLFADRRPKYYRLES